MEAWDCAQVCAYFTVLGADEGDVRTIRKEKIDGEALLELSEGDLRSLGMPLGLVKKHIKRLQATRKAVPTSPSVEKADDLRDLIAALADESEEALEVDTEDAFDSTILDDISSDDLPDLPPITQSMECLPTAVAPKRTVVAAASKEEPPLQPNEREMMRMTIKLDQFKIRASEMESELDLALKSPAWQVQRDRPQGKVSDLQIGRRKQPQVSSVVEEETLPIPILPEKPAGGFVDSNLRERSREVRECVAELTELVELYQNEEIDKIGALSVLAGINERIDDLIAGDEGDPEKLKRYIATAKTHCEDSKEFIEKSTKQFLKTQSEKKKKLRLQKNTKRIYETIRNKTKESAEKIQDSIEAAKERQKLQKPRSSIGENVGPVKGANQASKEVSEGPQQEQQQHLGVEAAPEARGGRGISQGVKKLNKSLRSKGANVMEKLEAKMAAERDEKEVSEVPPPSPRVAFKASNSSSDRVTDKQKRMAQEMEQAPFSTETYHP